MLKNTRILTDETKEDTITKMSIISNNNNESLDILDSMKENNSESNTATTSTTIAVDEISSKHLFLHMLISKQILLVGGNSEPRRVDGYDIELKKWRNWCNTDIVREVFFEVLWYHGYIYVFCGIHHSSYGSVERLNIVTNKWSNGPQLPGKLAGVVGTNLNDQLYIIGGYDWHTTEYSDAMFTLDIQQNKWVEHDARLRAGRSSHAAVTFQNKIWVAGGILDGQYCEGNETVEIFDPEIGYWVTGPSLNQRRFRLRLFVVDNELYAVGGDRDERGRLVIQTIDKLDINSNTWIYLTSFKQERRGFLSSVIDSKIYVIGGRSGDIPLYTWDYFDVKTGNWLSDSFNDNCFGISDLYLAAQSDSAALESHSILGHHSLTEHQYETNNTRFMNRRGGVVGGRAVSFPEFELTW